MRDNTGAPRPRTAAPVIMPAAAAVMVLSSYLRWVVTGNIKVDENYLSGLAGAASALLFLGALAAAGFAYVNTVLRRGGYDLDFAEVRKTALALVLISLLMMPMISNDVFSEIAYGDLVVRGINPFTHGEALQTSPYASYLGPEWLTAPYVKGPVSLALGTLAALIGKGSALTALAVFKLLILGFGLLFIGAASRFFAAVGTGGKLNVAGLVLLCPLVWVQGTGQAHTDLVAAALLMTALALAANRRFIAASLPLALAVLAKSPAAAAVPVFLLLVLRDLWTEKRKLALTLAASLGVAVAAALVLYAPFWDMPGTLSIPAAFLAGKTPSKSITVGITAAADFLAKHLGSGPAQGHGGDHSTLASGTVWTFRVLCLALVAYVLLGLRRSWSLRASMSAFASAAAIFICFYSPVFQPWYLLGVLPLFAGLESRDWVVWTAVVFTAANAMNVVHVIGPFSKASSILLPALVFGTIVLFFWRFKARFLDRPAVSVEPAGSDPCAQS